MWKKNSFKIEYTKSNHYHNINLLKRKLDEKKESGLSSILAAASTNLVDNQK